MKKKMSTQVLVFAALAVVINLLGGYLVQLTKVPLLFLDTVGTIFSAVLLGPWVGGLVGVVTNLVLGITAGPTNIPFAIVNLAVAIVVGFIARKWIFNLITSIITGLILSVICPLIGTPIAVAVFGGLTGSGTDLLVLWLTKAGKDIFTAAFISRITGNFVDKIASCVLVYFLIKGLPANYLQKLRGQHAA